MKKFLLFPCALIVAQNVQSQFADFEYPALAPESAWYGQDQVIDGDTTFENGWFVFENNYNAGWGSFAGWGYSSITDNTTPGWTNQYSAITGAGEGGSDQYGICYVSSWEGRRLFNNLSDAWYIDGMYVTNTTYAYYAMENGDSFTKPFGADTNAQGVIDGTNGEDWFLLTIYALGEDSLYTGDSVNFYLADFRFAADVDDYIIDAWSFVDLTTLGMVKGLDFVLTSSDTSGGFGMNNPAYFAMDNLTMSFGIDEVQASELDIYPNPTNGILNLKLENESFISLYDMNGKLIFETYSNKENLVLDLSAFENGIYLLTSVSDGVVRNQKVIKN